MEKYIKVDVKVLKQVDAYRQLGGGVVEVNGMRQQKNKYQTQKFGQYISRKGENSYKREIKRGDDKSVQNKLTLPTG